jgi:hypothetical protein
MARFLLSLTLLLTLLRSSDVQAACYAGSWVNGQPVYGSLYVTGGTTLAQCQALACQIYPSISPSCPQPCQVETETQIQSCPTNYTGQITQSRTKTCPDNTWQPWTTTQNTCVANPPTCQTSTQQQTLSCPTGYTGSITQTRSSTCPDPYGSPVWQPWVTTSDTCKKSINNPTNPVSPVSPLNPASATSAPTIQSSPVTAPTPNTVPNSETTLTVSTETQTTETTTDSQTTSTTQESQSPPPKGKVRSVVGLALSLELFLKPGLVQANVFPEVSIVQGIPNNILTQDLIMMDLLQQPSYNQPFDAPDLGFEQ